MKKILLTMAVVAMAVCGCRQQTSQQQPQTFLDTKAKAQADSARTTREDNVTDILMQRTPKGTPDKLLARRAYTTSYNHETRTPNWVAWTLTADHTRGSQQRADERFEEDTDVKTPRATYQDFYNSRYDRGHMCPAGDNKWDRQAMTETFLLTNICPQNHGLNKEDWNELEMQCRTWARRFGQITIVCGPVFTGEGQPRTIGKNKVRVPSAFYKLVYRPQPQPAMLAFVFQNHGKRQPWREQLCSVDEVEQLTGINFFPALPNDLENRLEAEASLKGW